MSLGSLNGEIRPVAELRIPVTDLGLLRGDGAFEVIRLYDGRPFALADHLSRLGRSAGNLRLALEIDRLRTEIAALLDAAGPADALLRLVVTRGENRLALVEPLPDTPPTLRLGYVTYAPTRVLDGIKSLSYAANMLATRVAIERGFDEALLVTPHGRVLEGPTASFFWVRDGRLLTPPLDDHILASITRGRILELTGAQEAVCTQEDVAGADEVFLAGTVREVLPVSAIEDREFPGGGPVTHETARLLREQIVAELESERDR